MAKSKHDSSPPPPAPLTDCQKQIGEMVTELRAVLDRADRLKAAAAVLDCADHLKVAAMDKERETVEADICLSNRSAYFDFHTWVVLNGVIDTPAERELDALFQRSLDAMDPGRFRESVQQRYDEFKAKCEQVRRGIQSSQLASSFVA